MMQKLRNKINVDRTQRSAVINFILKPVGMILGVIYTPLLLQYLGNEKYGLWSTVLTVISWFNYCDVGVGHGLRNLLTKELTNRKYEEVKKSVSTAYVILTLIASVLLVVSIICVYLLNWKAIFNSNINMRVPIGISFVFMCINFILALSNTLLYALQLSERVALINCLVQVINIIGLIILQYISSGNLVLISILFGLSTMIVYLWNTLQIFKRNVILKPKINLFEKRKIREICNIGIKFFVIQIDCIALYTVDNILITRLFGAEAVTPFNITYHVFNSYYAFLSALLVPYWSKTTEALIRRDYKWIKISIKRLKYICVLFCIGYSLIAVLFKSITYIWLGRNLNYSSGLIIVMCVYYCLYSVVSINIQFINGSGKINFQLILLTIMGVINVPFSIFLASTLGLGVVGIRLATTILMAVAAIAFPINLKYIIKKEEIMNNS